ncbi:acetolactate decarboxylase [Algoriphagus formosus]|uniref:acetolactate decarboxylase n=1 Tax=Algoriphagus formosus TaxID=2007308 RepID=UPI003F71F9ED
MKGLRGIILSFSILISMVMCSAPESSKEENQITIVGQMKNVMWKGELGAKIRLDSLSDKSHLYGLGPVEYLQGEVLILDGKAYKSTVAKDSTMRVEETFDIGSPFFGYSQVSNWDEQIIPDSIQSIGQLENYLNQITQESQRPFFFKVIGMVNEATIHIVNLPEGTVVSSPEEAHQGQVNYELSNQNAELIGFFSTEHQTIFTHHDSFMHIHLITENRQKMGHLDRLILGKEAKLYLPKSSKTKL